MCSLACARLRVKVEDTTIMQPLRVNENEYWLYLSIKNDNFNSQTVSLNTRLLNPP